MVEPMNRTPWDNSTFRDRHGRGMRAPMFGTRLPRYRTRSGLFDDLVAAQVRRLAHAWPKLVQDVQFAVEDVPPSEPTPWEGNVVYTSQLFPAAHGSPARIVLYRMPIEMHASQRIDIECTIRDELVLRLAQLAGMHPEDIDPQWKM